MAYKLQIGNAFYSGSLLHTTGDVEAAGTNTLSGSGLRVEGNVSITDDLIAGKGGITIEQADTVAQSVSIKKGSNTIIQIGNDASALDKGPQMTISDNSANALVEMGCDPDGTKVAANDAGDGFILLKDSSATLMKIASGDGSLSGSGNCNIKGNLHVGGNTTVAGNLTVNGTNVIVQATEVRVDAGQVKIAADHSAEGDLRNAGFVTGFGASPQLEISYQSLSHDAGDGADGLSQKRLKFIDNGGSGQLATLSANKFYGDGSNLTGISAGSYRFTVDERKSAGGDVTITEGVNYYTGSAAISLTLPTLSDASNDGKIFIIKSFNSATSVAAPITITPNGSNAIDTLANGVAIKIESGFGQVKLVAQNPKWRLV